MIRFPVVLCLALILAFPLGLVMVFTSLIDIPSTGHLNLVFATFGLLYSLTGFLIYKYVVSSRIEELGLFESLLAFSLTWIIIPVLFSIPLTLHLGIPLVDGVFESISGFTGTGLTVLVGLEKLNPSVLVWRGVMQWIGELGIVAFAAVLMPFIWRFSHILYSLERPVRILASLRRTAIRIFYLYVLVTAIGILACVVTGMSVLDAVVHAMTAIATGGMSNYDANYQRVFEYAPLSIYPITALMILGGVNFTILALLVTGNFKRAWFNEEFRAYVYLTLIVITAPLILMLPRVNWSLFDALIYGSFNALSGFTTTGFNIGLVCNLPVDVKVLITVFMFIGSMSFATVGGIKVVRLIVLLKALKSYIVGFLSGGVYYPQVKLSGVVLEEREVFNSMLLIILHFIFVFSGAVLIRIVLPSVDLLDSLFEATSAASAVGLSTGITGPQAPLLVKLVLIVLMYFGRLEYTPLLVLIGVVFYEKYSALIK